MRKYRLRKFKNKPHISKVEVTYRTEECVTGITEVLYSRNIEFWYNSTYDYSKEKGLNNIQINSADVKLDNVVYKNINLLKIDDEEVMSFYGYKTLDSFKKIYQ